MRTRARDRERVGVPLSARAHTSAGQWACCGVQIGLGKLPSIYPLIGGYMGKLGKLPSEGYLLNGWTEWFIVWELFGVQYVLDMCLSLRARLLWLLNDEAAIECHLQIVEE